MKNLVLSLLILAVALLHTVTNNTITTPIIEKPTKQETHYILEDDNKTLPCFANGEVSYKWMRDGKPVVSEIDGKRSISYDSSTGELSIISYEERFNGDYYCIAKIGDAAAMSQTQTLKQTSLSRFRDGPNPDYSTTEYEYVVLKCANQGELVGNDIGYNWYFSDGSKEIENFNDRFFVDTEGNLHFTYSLRTDATDTTNMYRCGYTSESSKVIFLGNNNVLTVKEVSSPQGSKPKFTYSNDGVKGLLGSSAKLECFFAGYDLSSDDHMPTIKWFHDDITKDEIKENDKYKLSKKNRVLTILKLKETDDKNFFCQGFTSSGNSDLRAVHLDVTASPQWVDPPNTQTKPEGETAKFNCNARSLSNEAPPEKPVWFVNGKKADSTLDHNRFIFSDENKVLTIKRLSKEDILCVQCKVKNHIGTLMGDACLNVVEPIKVLTQPPVIQEISKGDIVYMTIKAKSDPGISSPLTYEWKFKNKTYQIPTNPPFVKYNPEMDMSYINTSLLEQDDYDQIGGMYTCRIFNLYDSKTISTEVRLKDVIPPAPVAASAGMDMWIIGLIIGIIFLIVVIAIIIFVICRKQQEGDYNVDKKETGAGLDPEKELRDKGFNDLSRPDYDDYDYPEKKPRGDLEYDDVPIGGDDESLGEYGDEEDTHFNEDGSFIGIYQKKENERQNLNHQYKTESTI